MNNNLLSYKGYYGSVNFSAADEVFFGKIEGIHDLVSFEGETVKGLKHEFQKAVDDYILLCKKNGNPILKSLMGSFNIRIKPDLHQKAAIVALKKNISLNQLVQEAIEREVTLVGEMDEEYLKQSTTRKGSEKPKKSPRKA